MIFTNKNINCAPVVLFTYNRLDHTRQTIEALRGNVLAEKTELFIYSDAPKNEGAKDSVAAVRAYLRSVTGFKKIEIIEREENWGLARNIIDGVTEIINEYGKIIVLEDDIVTSRYFLKYMNDALEKYNEHEQVQSVSGYSYIQNIEQGKNAFFLPVTSCWGWGTWKRVWDGFTREPEKVLKRYTKSQIERFNLDGTYDFWSQIEMNADGKLYTWAVFFYELIFRNHGLCLYPPIPLVNNIGFDNSGEHCGKDVNKELIYIGDEYEIDNFPNDIVVDRLLYKKVKDRFKATRTSKKQKFINKLCLVFGKITSYISRKK